MSTFFLRLLAMAALGPCLACNPGLPTSSPQPGKTAGAVVATVNGVPITEADVQLGLKPIGHGAAEPSSPDRRKTVIAALIHDELVRQKAVELGLEPEGQYAEEASRLEAQASVARRHGLVEAYYRHQIAKKAEPTEVEARQFFEANAPMIRTEVHLWQILVRDEGQITQAQRELQAGASFEDVARRQFPGLPEAAGLPWELGFLSWKQLPDPWRPVLDALKPGEISPIIRGLNGRFWILKLLERRAKPELTFEDVKPLIVEDLKRARIDQLTLQADQELRKTAKIVEP